MRTELILLALGPVFIGFIGYEYYHHRRLYNIKDSIANTCLALMHQASDALALLLLMPLFYGLYEQRWFDLPLTPLMIIAVFLGQDFLYYWFHRACHNIHWLWAAHVVHHSSTHMNFSTALRQSIMYPVAGMWLFWTPLMLLGFSPTLVLSVVAINLAYQFFVHTQIIGKLGRLEKIFNTPSNHRVHHAINSAYIDRNYGGVLIIWDRLFGTYVEEDENNPVRYGIRGQIHTNNPITISFHQWLHLWQQLRKAPTWQARWQVLFGYPSISERVD